MTDALTVPQWAVDFMSQAVAWLGLEHYTIIARMEPEVEGDPNEEYVMRARVVCNYPYPDARVILTPHVENDQRGRESLLHELLHVALEPANRVAGHLCEMAETEQESAALWRMYKDAHEQCVSLIARGLASALVSQEAQSMDPQWYLINKADADAIRAYLASVDTDEARDALHDLETGLHTTDAVPDDWRDVLPAEKPDGSTESRAEGLF